MPAHRLLVLMPLERREPLAKLVASLADEPAIGLNLTSAGLAKLVPYCGSTWAPFGREA